jgi:hypothetical protein
MSQSRVDGFHDRDLHFISDYIKNALGVPARANKCRWNFAGFDVAFSVVPTGLNQMVPPEDNFMVQYKNHHARTGMQRNEFLDVNHEKTRLDVFSLTGKYSLSRRCSSELLEKLPLAFTVC